MRRGAGATQWPRRKRGEDHEGEDAAEVRRNGDRLAVALRGQTVQLGTTYFAALLTFPIGRGAPPVIVETRGSSNAGDVGHSAFGVDWSAANDLLIVPASSLDCPTGDPPMPLAGVTCPSGALPLPVTILRALPPIANSPSQGQLTTPHSPSLATAIPDAFPAFSRDGLHVAFIRWVIENFGAGPQSSYVRAVDLVAGTDGTVAGANERDMPFPGETITGVSWSSDGETLVFDRSDAGSKGLWTVHLDGTGLEQFIVSRIARAHALLQTAQEKAPSQRKWKPFAWAAGRQISLILKKVAQAAKAHGKRPTTISTGCRQAIEQPLKDLRRQIVSPNLLK